MEQEAATPTICFLVLAHANPEAFARLVRTLGGEGDPVVVHVDAKADEAAFRAGAGSFDVCFTDDRVDIRWGSSSIMRADMHLFRTAREQFPNADHYWLLSGDSYPTRRLSTIRSFLRSHAGSQFMYVWPIGMEHGKPLGRISHYRLDYDARSDKWRPSALLGRIVYKIGRRPFRRRLGGRRPLGGSHWVTLTGPALDALIEAQSTPLWSLALTSAHTEEWYMQTVIGNIPELADRILPGLTWADFRPTTTGYKPPPVREEQIEYLAEYEGDEGVVPLMARKFTDEHLQSIDRVESALWPLPLPTDR